MKKMRFTYPTYTNHSVSLVPCGFESGKGRKTTYTAPIPPVPEPTPFGIGGIGSGIGKYPTCTI